MVKNVKSKIGIIFGTYILLEIILISIFLSSFSPFVSSGVGQSVTVRTQLEVGAVFPEVLNISVNGGSDIVLIANSTKELVCLGLIRDYNNESDFQLVEAEFFDVIGSTYGGADDNNEHYTNSSCQIINDTQGLFGSVDDEFIALANCTFDLEYYSNAGQWNCTMKVTDKTALTDTNSKSSTILDLLAVGLPDSINYGLVNATYVSDEQLANVTNVGNTQLNLSLSGYAQTPGDGYAMNCSRGSNPFINILYEKYNLSSSTAGALSLSETENYYLNLTAVETVRSFNLPQRQNDAFNEAVNSTYWRIYVPRGVAGTCEGNIVFGAVEAPEI